jgi:uncharacterized protein YuzE
MKVSYDAEADALSIRLLEGRYECRTVRLTEDISLDFAPGEKLVSIEVLGASRLGVNPDDPAIALEHLRGIIATAA